MEIAVPVNMAAAFTRIPPPTLKISTARRALGNYSLPFAGKGNSWHGIREIRSPQGTLRRVFIVVITHLRLASRIRDSLLGQHATGY